MKRILCFGDSNTFGYDPRNYFGMPYEQPWPVIASSITGDQYINCGENGREIPASVYEIQWMHEDIEHAMPLNLILIMLGSNDILMSGKPDADLVVQRLENLINDLQSTYKDMPLCIITPPKSAIEIEQYNIEIAKLAERLFALCQKYNIDNLNSQDWPLELCFDGVHFNENTHKIFAKNVTSYVNGIPILKNS